MRRGKDDPQWQALKLRVLKRDVGCRLCRILSPQKAMTLMKEAGNLVNVLDPAHVFGAGPFPFMMYDDDNVVMLNRFSHDMLDTCHDPVTGKLIDKETRDKWWSLIVGEDLFKKLELRARSAGEQE